jgi:endonuclease/exonuclease/phosphatase family metal-dependent hydrolase
MNAEVEPTWPRSINLLSLNMWNIREPFEERMSMLVRFLRHAAPDIVALQEISPTCDGEPQSQMIAIEAGYRDAHYVKSGDWRGREEGLAVMTRMTSFQSRHITLPTARDDMRRIAQVVRVDIGGTIGSLYIVNTHFAFRPSDTLGRLAQAETLIESMRSEYMKHGRPIILCGDLNDGPESAPVRRLFEDSQLHLNDAWLVNGSTNLGWTLASSNRWARSELGLDRRIDYVAVSEALTVEECTLVLTGKDGWGPVSDHYGILARISSYSQQTEIHRFKSLSE